MSSRRPLTQSVDKAILSRVRGRGRGAVLLPSDFLDLGSRAAVDVALHRLTKKGAIRRLGRGIYDYPKEHPVLGVLVPSVEAIARAIAGRDRSRLQPTGAYAANLLGLSEQVPGRVVFLTDGLSRTVKVGSMTIELRRTTPRNMAAAGRLSGLLIQALRSLGADHVTPARIASLKRKLPLERRRELMKDIKLAPAWMHRIFRELAAE